MSAIEFVPFSFENADDIIEAIDKEWDITKMSGEMGRIYSELYLCERLSLSSRAYIAKADGQVAGIVTYRLPGEEKIDVTERVDALFKECTDGPGLKIRMCDSEKINCKYKELAASYDFNHFGELVLLIFTPVAKGKGLGRAAVEKAASDIKAAGCKHMFLYTDNCCNTGFYDHIGAVVIGEGTVECSDEILDIFLYKMDV